MSIVIETYGKYETYLLSERQIKAATFRKVKLTLTYFSELYGNKEITDLHATDMHTFFQWMKNKTSKKSPKGEKKKI